MTETIIQNRPLLLRKLIPSLRVLPRSIQSETSTSATPHHWRTLSLSPKSIIEKATTIAGLEALMVLTVVIGSFSSPIIPEIQELLTRTALIISVIWSRRLPALRKGTRKRVERRVVLNRTHITPFLRSACFLATS